MIGVAALYPTLDGLALASAIRCGDLRADEVLEAALTRAKMLNPSLGAICRIDAEAAHAALPRLNSAAPFVGVPFLMKDLGAPVRGLPTVAGAGYFARHAAAPAADSDLAARMRASGVVIFGKTTVPELGLNLVSEPAIRPVARNPWNLERSAGESSGGAAAAVAAGVVPLAHASDAGGSIRVPAAACGVLGLKPSRGLLPQGPDFGNLLMGMASELVVSRTVRDSAAMLDACSGAPRGPYAAPTLSPTLAGLDDPLPPLRIAVVETGPSWAPVGAEQSAAIAAIAGLLADEGHRIGSLPPAALEPLLSAVARCFDVTFSANLAALHASLAPPPAPDDFEPMTWAAIERGRFFTAADLFDAVQRAARAAYDLALRFEQVHVLLTPMLAYAPPLVGAFSPNGFDIEAHFAHMAAFAPYATLPNVTGVPAISVPHGRDGDGMPLAVQFIGPLGADGLLLRLARLCE